MTHPEGWPKKRGYELLDRIDSSKGYTDEEFEEFALGFLLKRGFTVRRRRE